MIQRLKIIVGVVVWLLVGSVFYYYVNNCKSGDGSCVNGEYTEIETCGWSFAESFYYAVQAGLSIGFGLLAETNDWSRAFTIYHVLAGSSFIGGALSLFISMSISWSAQDDASREARFAALKASVHLNRFSEVPGIELAEAMLHHPSIMREMLLKVENNDKTVDEELYKFEALKVHDRLPLVITAIKRAQDAGYEVMHTESISVPELEQSEKRRQGWSHCLRSYVGSHRQSLFILVLFFFWALVGIFYGVILEKWSFIQSLYFSVTTMSTAGLQAVSSDGSGAHVLFAGFYALIGVPLYGATVGIFANILVQGYNKKRQVEMLNSRVKRGEEAFVEAILERADDESISKGEYVVIQMLRHGLVDVTTLTTFVNHFDALDKNRSGKISRQELGVERHEQRARAVKSEELVEL